MDFKKNELKFVDNEIKQRMLELDETGSFLFSYVLKMWDLIKVILQHYGLDEETLKMTKETLENVKLLHLGWSVLLNGK